MESVCVDPCPDVPGYDDQLQGDDRVVLKLRPGITGPATLKYRLEDVLVELMDAFGEKVEMLQHEKLLVLAACVSDGYVSNYRLQFVLDQHPADITQLLKELCEDGYLKASGIGKGTKYSLNVASNVSGNVASNVWDEGGVSKRTRQLYCAIREACPDYLPLTEIALKVNRKLRYLKNNVIPDMVAMGLLERKYPNVPSHPYQQYRCTDDE